MTSLTPLGKWCARGRFAIQTLVSLPLLDSASCLLSDVQGERLTQMEIKPFLLTRVLSTSRCSQCFPSPNECFLHA